MKGRLIFSQKILKSGRRITEVSISRTLSEIKNSLSQFFCVVLRVRYCSPQSYQESTPSEAPASTTHSETLHSDAKTIVILS